MTSPTADGKTPMIVTYKYRIKDKHSSKLLKMSRDVNFTWNWANDTQKPEDLHITIMKLAQTAADAHEAQMRAQILGERYVGIDVSETIAPQAPAEEADTPECNHNWTKHFGPNGFSHYECSRCGKDGREADSTKEAAVTQVQFDNQGMPEYIFTKDAVYKISSAQEVEQPAKV